MDKTKSVPARAFCRSPGAFFLVAVSLFLSFLLLGCAQSPPPPAPDTVSVQYFYADWCHYCQNSIALAAIQPQMGGRLMVERLNEADRATNSTLAKIYDDYKTSGVFGGFPTLVAHGPKGQASFVGYHEPAVLKKWLCDQFNVPPPACANP
ncbi:MAG: hypothetical protein V1728_00835 [Candidatus Micrarchaeota archaeon]